jgi:FAD synthetase
MKAIVFGTFDILHPGHISFLKQAKKYGNNLIVVIGRDKTVAKIKGDYPKHSENERLNSIEQLDFVNRVLLGDLKDPYSVIKREKPDVICLGYDQKSYSKNLPEKIKEFKLNTKIVRLKPYKPEKFKSSYYKNK